MRTLIYALFLLAVVVVVTKLALEAPAFQEDLTEGRPEPPESLVFTSHGNSKADYIAFLRRTTETKTVEDEQDLQRRIQAVKNNAHWP